MFLASVYSSQRSSEQGDLATSRQVLDVALEVPLPLLARRGRRQRDDARPARIQVLHEPLDAAALARRITTLEQHHEPLIGVLDPALRLEQLDLQQPLRLLVVLATESFFVGIALAPGLDRQTVGADEHRVVDLVEGPLDREPTTEQISRRQLSQRRDRLGQIDHMVTHAWMMSDTAKTGGNAR